MGILLVLVATEAAPERLFEVNVNFKPNSSRLLEISFERQELFSVLGLSLIHISEPTRPY